MGMVNIRDKLKDLVCPFNDATLLHHVMISLPPIFEPFKINYNGSDQKWDIPTLVAKCSQEEEMLLSQNPKLVNHVRQDGYKIKNKRSSAPRMIRRVRNPMMLLSRMVQTLPRVLCATSVTSVDTSRSVPTSRSGALRKGLSDAQTI